MAVVCRLFRGRNRRHYAGFRTIPGELAFELTGASLAHFPGIVRRVFLPIWAGRRTLMKQVFKSHRLCKQDGPLGPYVDSYAAEMRGRPADE